MKSARLILISLFVLIFIHLTLRADPPTVFFYGGVGPDHTMYIGDGTGLIYVDYDAGRSFEDLLTNARIDDYTGVTVSIFAPNGNTQLGYSFMEVKYFFTPPATGSYNFYTYATTFGDESWTSYGQLTVNVVPGPGPSATIAADNSEIAVGQTTYIRASYIFPPGDSSVGSNIDAIGPGFSGGAVPGSDGSAQTSRVFAFTPTSTGTYIFYAVIQTQYFPFAIYSETSVSVQTPPTITTQPTSQAIVVTQNAAFHVAATGTGPISYQWQVSTDGGSTWNNASGGSYSGATITTLTVSNTTLGMNGYQFRCMVTNPYGTTPSSGAVLTVDPGVPITTQSQSIKVPVGSSGAFSVGISNGVSPITYQWQESTNGGSTWNNLNDGGDFSGSATSVLSVSADPSLSGDQFRVIVSDPNGSSTSNAATLTVVQAGGVPTLPPWALASFIGLAILGAKATLSKKRQAT